MKKFVFLLTVLSAHLAFASDYRKYAFIEGVDSGVIYKIAQDSKFFGSAKSKGVRVYSTVNAKSECEYSVSLRSVSTASLKCGGIVHATGLRAEELKNLMVNSGFLAYTGGKQIGSESVSFFHFYHKQCDFGSTRDMAADQFLACDSY